VKSVEHAVVGAVVSAAAATLLFPTPSGVAFGGLVLFGVLLSVFVDLDHFLIARAMAGDWRNLERAVTNPRVGLVEQEKVFAELDEEGLIQRRLLSHHLIGGALTLALALLGLGRLAVFVAVVLYAHVLCDYLRDIGYA
jgi:hypothetical protein